MTKLTPLLQSLRILIASLPPRRRMLWLGLLLAGALAETLTPRPIGKED